MDKVNEENTNDVVGVAQVNGVFVQDEYGTRKSVFCGRSVALDLLRRGLWITFDRPVDPETVNRASCFLVVDLPFPLGEREQSAWNSQLLGFHSLSIAAYTQLSRADEIHWCPQNNVAAFLERVFVVDHRSPSAASFADDWDVRASSFQPQKWGYSADGNAVDTCEAVGLCQSKENLGNICLKRQAIENDAQYVGVSATTLGGDIGIVFNWKSDQDYWVFLCEMQPQLERRFTDVRSCQTTIMHILRGLVVHRIERLVPSCESPKYIDLDIKQASYGLIFGGQVRSSSFLAHKGYAIPVVPFSAVDLPTRFELGSQIGLFGRRNHAALFTRMDVVYPDVKLRLIPRSGQMRLMARLIIRNSCLRSKPSHPQGQISDSFGPMSHYRDLEMWFWLTLPHELYGYSAAYGYGYGSLSIHTAPKYRGIGADLI
jgi:hypothetical protein